VFRSFFLAGFECATGYNMHKEPIDQICATRHDVHVQEDYRRLRKANLLAAREGVRWPLVDRKGRYEFESLKPFIEAAQEENIEVIFDLFHYGMPDDVDLLSEEFAGRFAAYCHATARFLSEHYDGDYYFTPVNEPSFFAWACGDAARFAPFLQGRSYDVKVALMKAAIQGIDAIWDVLPKARMVNVDPICRTVAPRDEPELQPAADHFNEHGVFECWDMLAGRKLPELGGSRKHLDIIGLNYYWTNQWEITRDCIPLADDDERRVRLADLVQKAYLRYGGELLLTETAHVGEHRGRWMRELTEEILEMRRREIPLKGACLYPILGMPEWHAQDEWTNMGLWDIDTSTPDFKRVVCPEMMDALEEAQAKLGDLPAQVMPAEAEEPIKTPRRRS
jgi:hypothetical protein